MYRYVAVALATVLGATVVHAQNADAIKQRREVMRTIAKAGSEPFKMTKDEAPFNLAAVQTVLKAIEENAPKFKTMFPDNSKVGATEATAKVWTNRAEFDAVADKWVSDAKAALVSIKDEATFKTDYPKMTQACAGCHGTKAGFSPSTSDSFKRMQTPLE